MKWIGGVILLIITIILLALAIFMFPWFITKTDYDREIINSVNENYWDEKCDGIERDSDESVYYLQNYELKTSTAWDWNKNGSKPSKSSGQLSYNSAPAAGGWDGSYRSMVEAGYPVGGFLAGGNEQLSVYNFTYYMVIFGIIMACIAIVFIIVAGFEKMSVIVPKVMVGVAIIFVILAPLYFALALPPAIEKDDEEWIKVADLNKGNVTIEHSRPAEAGGIMGSQKEKDKDTEGITSQTEFSPGLGWWLAIGAIFTTIITIGFVTGPAPPGTRPPDYSRGKYHEYDHPDDRRYEYDRGSGQDYGPPGRSGPRSDGYYEDDYQNQPQEQHDSRDQYRYDNSGRNPDYDSRGYNAGGGRTEYDYGRPTPRPPGRGAGHPPPPPRSRRRGPPPRY